MIRNALLWIVAAVLLLLALPILLICAPFLMFRDRPSRNDASGDDRE